MAPGKTLFGWAVYAQRICACIQRQLQARRALCTAPVVQCSGCRGEEKRAFEKPNLPGYVRPDGWWDKHDHNDEHNASIERFIAPLLAELCRVDLPGAGVLKAPALLAAA